MLTVQSVLNVVFACIIAYLLNVVRNKHAQVSSPPDQADNPDHPIVSSVWCHQGNNRMCQFVNLCYKSDEDEFVMFRHAERVTENVQFKDGSLTVDLSSVQGHNTMQTTIVSLPSELSVKFNVKWITRKSLIFKPFLPDNLMHMLHDDILPLHDSLKYLTFPSTKSAVDTFSVQIIVFNDTDEEINTEMEISDQFYHMFSEFPTLYKKDLYSESSLTCFRDVTLGLSTRTTWYDYGFTKHQGPLTGTQVTSQQIAATVRFINNKLNTAKHTVIGQDFVILLTRKENRRILNEAELILAIVQKTRLKVINLSLDTHSVADIIYHVTHSRGIIGMHGSLLVLSMFLKPNSFLIELFPFAVNPEHYTPYKTLCQISGMNIVYMAWTNQDRDKSIPHPDWPPEMGGVNHLEESERDTIIGQTEVPQHLCCTDPSWLYHIYQDTLVDTSTVTGLVESCLEIINTKKSDISHKSEFIHPSKVKGVTCQLIKSKLTSQKYIYYDININFSPPWTLSITDTDDQSVRYEILMQNTSADNQLVIHRQTLTNSATIQVDEKGQYAVWIRCVVDDADVGPYSDVVFCDDIS